MPNSSPEERVLIFAPIGQDAPAMAALLRRHGLESQICDGAAEAAQFMAAGAGALVLTEEALEMPRLPELLGALRAQPTWSELPVIVLTRGGEPRLARLLEVVASSAGSITILERPIAEVTLERSIEVALRSRRRQYQVRNLLEEQRRKQHDLEVAQTALREREERYRTLVSQVKEYAIFRTDTAGCATSWNEGVKRLLGFAENEWLGRDVAPLIFTPEDVLAGVPQREFETATREGSASNDRWMQQKGGTQFFASGMTTALRDDSGAVIGFSKVLRDATDRKLAQEHLERTVAERTEDLRAANEQLEAFVYSIAHDLRAPLRSMTGYSQILMEDFGPRLDEAAQSLLRRIQASSEFMDKLLLDLLAYGRTARAEMELEPVEVRTAWETATFQCATQIEQTQAQVEAIEPLPVVLAHQATLGQCLANLLSNGLKFVLPGVRPQVRCRAEQRGDYTRIWVEDNGIGVPADQHERVFRVFERLQGSRYAGTGIGLSIVRKGVERMGGTVGLESEPGSGSRFWIELLRNPHGRLNEKTREPKRTEPSSSDRSPSPT